MTLFAIVVFFIVPLAILIGSEEQRHDMMRRLAGTPELAVIGGAIGIGILVLLLFYSLYNQLKFARVEIDEVRREFRFYKGWVNRHLLTLAAGQIKAVDVIWERLQINRASTRYSAILMLQAEDKLWYAVCTSTRVSVMKKLVEIVKLITGCRLNQGAVELVS